VMDEQGTRMQFGGIDLQELEAQRAELVPDRVVMKRRRRRKRHKPTPPPGVGELCVMPYGCRG
jgi:hypothetical protein